METLNQINDRSQGYSGISRDELMGMTTDEIQARMSRSLIQLEEAEDNRKAYSSAFGSLIKKIKADIRTMNGEIRERSAANEDGNTITVESIQARLASGLAG
ncbi:MAG: hypothetical protein M3Q07_26960 [Pseudobdellovibrionaceae bacterium]|nr:hypothetical protein [Pseudobdellovibrionaceae bacterium]